MILVSYDISDDKLRTRFSKYLNKFGRRLQYSVFEIKNSERILNNISSQIENQFSKEFSQTDSVLIFRMPENCEIQKYGYAKNENDDFIIIEN